VPHHAAPGVLMRPTSHPASQHPSSQHPSSQHPVSQQHPASQPHPAAPHHLPARPATYPLGRPSHYRYY
jgi:hypothetical protein